MTELEFLKSAPNAEDLDLRAKRLRQLARNTADINVFKAAVVLAESYEAAVDLARLNTEFKEDIGHTTQTV